jgi:hypothetical protein
MKLRFLVTLGLSLAAPSGAWAHDGAAGGDDLHARSTAEENVVEASVVVRGTVAAHKGKLYRLDRWPQIFSDVRALVRNADGTWTADFRVFGHPHDFHVARTAGGVLFTLAAKDHGAARMEWTLRPLDADRSTLTVRLSMSTPPQLTRERALGLLGAKARIDLDDFSKLTLTR